MAGDAVPAETAVVDGARELPEGHLREGTFPSRGLRYGGAHADGLFKMRLMTTEEEEMLNSKGISQETKVDQLLKRCWVDPEIPYEDLLCADQLYMLFFLRSISVVEEKYRFDLRCPDCGKKFRHGVTLPGDQVRRELEPSDPEPFYAELPFSKDKIGLRALRVRDEQHIRRQCERNYDRSTQQGSREYTVRLGCHLAEVNGEPIEFGYALAYVRKMVTPDSDVFKRALEKNDFGLALDLETRCPHCGGENKFDIPYKRDFFRASE